MSLKDQTVGFVATPEDMRALQEYIQLFSGEERVIANTCAFMAWNLACKIAEEGEEETILKMIIDGTLNRGFDPDDAAWAKVRLLTVEELRTNR